jgi:AraC family transcriptional regulator
MTTEARTGPPATRLGMEPAAEETTPGRSAFRFKATGSPRGTTVVSRHSAVRRVVDAMHERLLEPLSLDELARLAILSPYHFHRVFRDVTGVPPGRFLAALRMHEAKRLLLTTQHRVTDVCFEVGYTSLGTFTTNFKNLVGLAPCQLRQLALDHGSKPIAALVAADETASAEANVTGHLETEAGFEGVAFVGLFPKPLPQSKPIACTVVRAPGSFRLAHVADGRHHALAAAFLSSETVLDALLGNGSLRIGLDASAVKVRGGGAARELRIALREPRTTDPPVVLALPLVLADQIANALAASHELAVA